MAIIRDTVKIMRMENNPQWDSHYPVAEDFLADIQEGSLYVCDREGRIAGLICVNRAEPEEYARVAWRRPGPAMVIHRMAVSPDFRRQGVASALMHWADKLAEQSGLNYLKTDTFSGNDKMNLLFRKNGFVKTGEITLRNIERKFFSYDKLL